MSDYQIQKIQRTMYWVAGSIAWVALVMFLFQFAGCSSETPC